MIYDGKNNFINTSTIIDLVKHFSRRGSQLGSYFAERGALRSSL